MPRLFMKLARVAPPAAVVGATLLVAGPGQGAEPGPDAFPISVLAVATDDAFDQAEALTKALRSVVRHSVGWSLTEDDYALPVLVLQLKCSEPPDLACQALIADQIKADRFVWGTLKKKDKKSGMVVASLHLWVRDKVVAEAPLEYSENLTEPGDDALRLVATDALKTLTGGPPKGTLQVTADDVAGQVFVDDVEVGALAAGKGSYEVAMGEHTVRVKSPGYGDMTLATRVQPSKVTSVVFRPKVAPVQRGPRGCSCSTPATGFFDGTAAVAVLGLAGWLRRSRRRAP